MTSHLQQLYLWVFVLKRDWHCGFGQGMASLPEILAHVGHSALLHPGSWQWLGSHSLLWSLVQEVPQPQSSSHLLSTYRVLTHAKTLAFIVSLNPRSTPAWELLSPPSFTEEETSSERWNPACQIGCGIWPPGRMQPPLSSLLWLGTWGLCVSPCPSIS